jgi:hypothetical protein
MDLWTYENCQTKMCNSIPANLTSTVCNGNGNCISVDNCTCNNGYIGKWCENNCNSLYYYIDLANTLNKTLNDVKILNQNLNETLKNVNELNKNLTEKNNENFKLLGNNKFLINNLTEKNIENTQLIINLNNVTKDLNISNNNLQEKIKENNNKLILLLIFNQQINKMKFLFIF